MKIAIYGVSCAGKNYIIEKIITRLNGVSKKQAIHLEGSTTLNLFANEIYNTTFKMLSDEEKDLLRRKFTELIKEYEAEYEVVIVDGHYAFINSEGFKVVFTEEDRNVYDTFLYLDTPAEMIVRFSQNRDGDKRNTAITPEQVRLWKSFEKEQLRKICGELNKELIIIDEDTETCVDFIESYINDDNGYCYQPRKIAKRIIDNIQKNYELPQNILIVDCDKTISENDVTYEFCRLLEIDGTQLKQIFRNDRYTTYQFYKVARLYGTKSSIEIKRAASIAKDSLKLNAAIVADINNKEYFKIGITAGVYQIWQFFLGEHMLHFLIGCSEIHKNKDLITPSVKKEVASVLREMGKTVTAIGDSVIDIPMLEAADNGFIVAHEKLNLAVIDYFKQFPDTGIKQLSYSKQKYANIEILKEIL